MDDSHMLFSFGTGSNNTARAECLTASDLNLTNYSSASLYSGTNPENCDIVSIDSARAIAAYANAGYSTGLGYVECVTLDGTTTTGGTNIQIGTGPKKRLRLAKMDDTHTILLYQDSNNSNVTMAVCLTISDTTITVNTPFTVDSGNGQSFDITRMDSTHAIASFGVYPNLYVRCLVLTDTTISAGSRVTLSTSGQYGLLTNLDSTTAVIMWIQAAKHYGAVLTLSDTTISYTTTQDIINITGSDNSLAVHSDSRGRMFFTYPDLSPTQLFIAELVKTGSVLSKGYSVKISDPAYSSEYVDLCSLPGDNMVAVFRQSTQGYGRIIRLR